MKDRSGQPLLIYFEFQYFKQVLVRRFSTSSAKFELSADDGGQAHEQTSGSFLVVDASLLDASVDASRCLETEGSCSLRREHLPVRTFFTGDWAAHGRDIKANQSLAHCHYSYPLDPLDSFHGCSSIQSSKTDIYGSTELFSIPLAR